MKTPILSLMAILALSLVAQPAQSRTLDLVFMPPLIEEQNICGPVQRDEKEDELTNGPGSIYLTNPQRLRFIARDIRRLMVDDPDQWFDFIMMLLEWRERLDPEVSSLATLLDKIRLHIDADRLEQLKAARLLEQLREQDALLTSSQRLILAHYYLGGIGVAPDIDYAHELIRIAAYAGNAGALMDIARLELQGTPVPDWDAPLDMTVTLAFSGMLGQMNSSVCRRAERIAQEYRNGDVVSSNPDVVYAWYKFAADLGAAEAAWRVVEFHLSADAARKDNEVMLHYLRLAIDRGFALEDAQVERLKSVGDVDEATLRSILGYNLSADTGRTRPSVSLYFQLAVNLDGETADRDGQYFEYLQELSQFEAAPGWVFTLLAKEVEGREGRWAAEPKILALLETATERGDPDGMQLLAQKLIHQRDDPAQLHRAINLLMDTVSRHGMMSSMDHLDALYRCQANEAPMLAEAEFWATNYQATQDRTVRVSPTDLIALDPFREPFMLAKLQSQALEGRSPSLAGFLQRIQVNPWASKRAQRLWAARTDHSDKALEAFVKLEFALATNPAERHLAVELFRRVYLNNGVTTALDLATVLVEDNSRNPVIAQEIIALLTKAGNRGEGASIWLKARLLPKDQHQIVVYEEFKDIIEERGDFLALLFSLPYIPANKLDDYIDRAVSLMHCGTKDADVLGDGYAIHMKAEMSYHWRRIGLNFRGGNVLSKLGLSDSQMRAYNIGTSPTERDIYLRLLDEGEKSASRNLFLLTADTDLETYDPEAASEYLLAILARAEPGDELWVLRQYHRAVPALRAILARKIDIENVYRRAAESGDTRAQLDYGLYLRQTATTIPDLQQSAHWLNESAEGGNVAAMTELGYAMAMGLGGQGGVATPEIALSWLEKAAQLGDERAEKLARLVRLGLGL